MSRIKLQKKILKKKVDCFKKKKLGLVIPEKKIATLLTCLKSTKIFSHQLQ